MQSDTGPGLAPSPYFNADFQWCAAAPPPAGAVVSGSGASNRRAMTKLRRESLGDVDGDETDDELYADDEDDLAAALKETDSCEDEDEGNGRRHFAGGGIRVWPSDVVYPLGNRQFGSVPNLQAALAYDKCCSRCCLTRVAAEMEPNGITALYAHRQQFRQSVSRLGGRGGDRDATRDMLAAHYDVRSRKFQHTFVIAGVSGCCVVSAAIAASVSEATYARARGDVTKARPRHAGRSASRKDCMSSARRTLDAWVRTQRAGMEGDKICGNKWYSEKVTGRQLWERYLRDMNMVQQPSVGNPQLLYTVWKSHTEIHQVAPTGHDICDQCESIRVQKEALAGLTDTRSQALVAELEQRAKLHRQFHLTERDYYDDASFTALKMPWRCTCLTIDAPTKSQFDIPSQATGKRDNVKGLDARLRWATKLEAVIDSGLGMHVYGARAALGGGGNLMCTSVMLALMKRVEMGRPLGLTLHLQLDNTTGENKNNTVIALCALLVHWGVFVEARMFFMPKGHTYSLLDQSFGPLITGLKQIVVLTQSELFSYVETKLGQGGYNPRDIKEVPYLWDFKTWIGPTVCAQFGGIATNKMCDGFHEFNFLKDDEGIVRMWCRATSQATDWMPNDQAGYRVFHVDATIPKMNETPPIMDCKKDGEWDRTGVQVTIRRWIRALTVGNSRAQEAAEREWEEFFSKLPQDGDPASLAPASRLRWCPLPAASHTQLPRSAASSSLATVQGLDMIENPPVNPIEGPGRSSHAIAKEIVSYQEHLRLSASSTSAPPPVFQADFLLLRAKDPTRVILGKVIAAPKGGMLLEKDLCSVVEYECVSPNDGLLGPVRPRLNPFYPKQGLQHLRVGDVKRDDILVYGVKVDYSGKGDERKIKIKQPFLHLLAAAHATFVMPTAPTALGPVPVPAAAAGTTATAGKRNSTSSAAKRRRGAGAEDSSDEEEGESSEGQGGEEEGGEQEPPGLLTRDTLTGRRVLVPREAWPNEPCDGDGWWGKVKRVALNTAKVLMEVDGEIYDFEVGAILKWCGP